MCTKPALPTIDNIRDLTFFQIRPTMKPHNTLILAASLVSASTLYVETVGSSPVRQHTFNESNLNDLQEPNGTNSVNFLIGGEEWTWRVNVTSLSVPDARITNDANETLPDPRLIVSTFDLQWPRTNETLNETAIHFNDQTHASSQSTHGPQISSNTSSDDPICMSVLTTPIWPNATNKLQDQDSSSCEAVIGQSCLQSILSDNLAQNGRCSNPSLNGAACEDAFGVVPKMQIASSISGGFYHDRDNFTSYYGAINSPTINMSYHEQSHSGEGVYYSFGQASPEANETALREAESMFRMMVLTLPGNLKAAVCTRVDTSIDDEEVSIIAQRPNWNDGDSGYSEEDESESSGDDDNDSSSASPKYAATMGTVGLVGLAVAVFGLL